MKHIIGANPLPPALEAKTVMVGEESVGQRLDNFLMRSLKGVPKSHVYRIIRSGEVRINKGRGSAQTRLNLGDAVRIPPVRVSERAQAKTLAMADVGLSRARERVAGKSFPVVFEDAHFLAIDKPAGVAVHGGSGVSFGVIEQLRIERPEADFLELVHRLDRETSGLLLVAKKRSALKHLQDQFRARETVKTYLAMVHGHWPHSKKVLDKPLHKYLLPSSVAGVDGERRVKVVAKSDPNGMPSLTLVKVHSCNAAASAQPYSLLEVTIKTGRTHQIRVHLASEGMPILGDDKYGDFALNKELHRTAGALGLQRMFLHAWRLGCTHPATGETIALHAALPADLSRFLLAAFPLEPFSTSVEGICS